MKVQHHENCKEYRKSKKGIEEVGRNYQKKDLLMNWEISFSIL